MKAVLVLLKNGKLVRRERCFPDWKAYEAFLAALSRGRWARVYRSGAYFEARRQGLYLEVLGKEDPEAQGCLKAIQKEREQAWERVLRALGLP
ncbi:hypothetical protein TthAA37_25350 (plasmid) [Thermus thermophilus]|uniref:hypothetical protein n=1 Tax=Thermus thermophilus TaxID=274 RepID=UPI001C7541A1|nr:hypothetical protein [Thermus thermophilus]BCZ93346.1 hypothetical protein TthAA37_25350 [Thermus thermophilus]